MIKYALLTLSILFFIVPAYAGSALTFENAYAYPTSKVQKNGAVFVTVNNTTDTAQKIISAHSDIAERIELHTHIMDGDVMMMREVEGYEIPANGNVTLDPMGHHIMLFGLNKQLMPGETFVLKIQTEQGEMYEFPVTVGDGS